MIAFRCELPDGRHDRATGGRTARRRLCAGDRRRAAGESGCDAYAANAASGGRAMPMLAVDPATVATLAGIAAQPSTLVYVVVDRLAAGSASDSRLRDSLETAFTKGRGRCYVFVEEPADGRPIRRSSSLGTEVPIPSPLPLPSPRCDRRPAVAADRLQHAVGLRGLRHRVSAARAAAVQLQQPAGRLSRVRRVLAT